MDADFGITTDTAASTAIASTSRSITAAPAAAPYVPDYLTRTPTYRFAYLQRFAPLIFDHPWVVSTILWGNAQRLADAVFGELHQGHAVLQAACVYGDFSARLGRFLGPKGRLDVIDVVPVQVANGRRKLRALPQVSVRLADAATPIGKTYDAVCCFFLLHELPDAYKRRVVDNLLTCVRPGGKVIFVDYHKPRRTNPLKAIVSLVFRYLEPFARSLWEHDIRSFASDASAFDWRTETYFGDLFQKTVARRPPDD